MATSIGGNISLHNSMSESSHSVTRLNIEPYESSMSWSVYIKRLKNKFKLYEIPEEKQVLILLDVIGTNTYERILDLCEPEVPEDKTFADLEVILSSFFEVRRNKYAERLKFSNCFQGESVSILDFAAELKKTSRYCKFPENWLQEALITQFINGINNDDYRQKILSLESIKDFNSLTELTMNFSVADKLSKEKVENRYTNSVSVDKVTMEVGQSCFRCRKTNHHPNDCFFKNANCHICNKNGHIAVACKLKSQRNSKCSSDEIQKSKRFQRKGKSRRIQNVECFSDSEFEVDPETSINTTTVDLHKDKPIYTKLWLNGKMCNFMIDTGSMLTLMSRNMFQAKFPNVKIVPTDVKLSTYTGSPIIVFGKAEISVESSVNNSAITLDVYIVEGKLKSLVGRDWLRQIKLDWSKVLRRRVAECKVNLLSSDNDKDIGKLIERYKIIFSQGVGKIPNRFQATIHLKSDTPVFRKPFKVPLAIEPLVTNELVRLENEGIITKVPHSEYATPVVPVIKKDGSVRLCGNYKVTLNPLLHVDQHPIPSVDQVVSRIGGKQYYSKLDISQAFTHIEVCEGDRKKLTINTHKGLFQMNRLPFGIASAPAIWQETIEKILMDVPNIVIMFDDIAVGTNSKVEHYKTLEEIFRRLNENNVRLNVDKCKFFQTGIEYCGYYVCKEGLKKCKDKVEAILKVSEPKNVTEVKSFLGLVNFYGKFCPKLSEVASPLFDLLRKDVPFHFYRAQREAFSKIKQIISSDTVLCAFDPLKRVVLATDAGPKGISAVLSHEINGTERPISFSSRTLNRVEQKYSQIDREALAIVWGVKKYVEYIYGRKFTLITDNKALTSIFSPKKDLPAFSAMKMQHYALFLQNFNYDIKYRRSEDNGNVDCLSRFPLPECLEKGYNELDRYEICQIETIYPVTAEELRKELDPEVRNLIIALKNGSTIEMTKCFGHKQEEFHLFDDCLFLGQRVYIPSKYRGNILTELHRGHQGIVKTKALARSYVWWPNIDVDIEHLVKSCQSCQSVANNPVKSVHVWERATAPMERLHIDYAGPFRNHYFFIITDAYSRWVEVNIMKDITSNATIECLTSFFTNFGTPHVLVSDNGPQFTSEIFKEFCKENGIQHKLIAPYHPASNGSAERCVQSLKHSLKATLGMSDAKSFIQLKQAVRDFLVTYRKTPHSTSGQPPSLLFLGRNIRTRIDLVRPTSKIDPVVTLIKREFFPGDKVLVRFYQEAKWEIGKVIEKTGQFHYTVEVNGRIHRRHIDQLKSFVNQKLSETSKAKQPSNPLLSKTGNLNFEYLLKENKRMSKIVPSRFSQEKSNDDPPQESQNNPDQACSSYNAKTGFTRSGRQIKPPERLNL